MPAEESGVVVFAQTEYCTHKGCGKNENNYLFQRKREHTPEILYRDRLHRDRLMRRYVKTFIICSKRLQNSLAGAVTISDLRKTGLH